MLLPLNEFDSSSNYVSSPDWNKCQQQSRIQSLTKHPRQKILRKQLAARSLQSQNTPSQIFDGDFNTFLSNIYFALVQRITVFKYQYFVIYGPNISPVMFLRSFSILRIQRPFLMNALLMKKMFKFAKINYLMFRKIRQK